MEARASRTVPQRLPPRLSVFAALQLCRSLNAFLFVFFVLILGVSDGGAYAGEMRSEVMLPQNAAVF